MSHCNVARRHVLGGCAWVLQTRMDIAIYVASLQRHSKKPKIIHIKRLNTVVRYMQAHPMELTYAPMKGHTTMLLYSDSVFKKEDVIGHALKGSVYLRVPTAALPRRTTKGLDKTTCIRQRYPCACH